MNINRSHAPYSFISIKTAQPLKLTNQKKKRSKKNHLFKIQITARMEASFPVLLEVLIVINPCSATKPYCDSSADKAATAVCLFAVKSLSQKAAQTEETEAGAATFTSRLITH